MAKISMQGPDDKKIIDISHLMQHLLPKAVSDNAVQGSDKQGSESSDFEEDGPSSSDEADAAARLLFKKIEQKTSVKTKAASSRSAIAVTKSTSSHSGFKAAVGESATAGLPPLLFPSSERRVLVSWARKLGRGMRGAP
eukprot:1543697-Karenia_brevis.AAC.1